MPCGFGAGNRALHLHGACAMCLALLSVALRYVAMYCIVRGICVVPDTLRATLCAAYSAVCRIVAVVCCVVAFGELLSGAALFCVVFFVRMQ